MSGTEHGMLLDDASPLTAAMALHPGDHLDVSGLAEPKVSAHLAVVLRERLSGEVSAVRALLAVEAVCGALLASEEDRAVRWLTGPAARPVNEVDLLLEGCLVEVDGQIADSATIAAVRLAETLVRAARTGELPSGAVLLTGALTEPVSVRAGMRVAGHFSTLGSLTVAVR
ncbi:2-oxo-3-hexenedioate decarboxylase [Amycolatopsis marina]|uniref:2-oxo-3-hexenedioate decarboxylase n=1 Tax=Amycolatopsis marina TaxID=490629 RepID=A0A1I0WVU5_9PSEU|nr:hypothetical protein [Amycolatopsis marina]SFA92771.1 2-oxo-3-hexenedioate decarboxylase [Amycolatopsis marina]